MSPGFAPGAIAGARSGAGGVSSGRFVSVLDADPDLARDVPEDQHERASRCSRAEVTTWYPHEENPLPASMAEPGAHGLLVLEGSAAGRFVRAGRTRAELVGPEDLLRPWVQLDGLLGTAGTMEWEVLEPMRMAILDRRWASSMSPWPQVCAGLLDRLVLKGRRLCFQMTAAGHPRGEDRVRLQLWQLAEQWGRVTSEGIVIDVPVTHRLLAELTGSRRPTITSAIGRLRSEGELTPLDGRRFLLHGAPPEPTALGEVEPTTLDGVDATV